MGIIPSHGEGERRRQVLRLAPEYRRCGLYLLLFWILLPGLLVGLKLADHIVPRSWADACMALALLVVPHLGIAVLTWRQGWKVDDRGIWQRHLFRWDLWPWDAFAAGAVRMGASKVSWVFPAKPWNSRYLYLEFLAEHDRNALADRILQVWKPPAVRLPHKIQIRYSLGKHLELSRQGIVLRQGRSDPNILYSWSEVLQVRVRRFDHLRRDYFDTLELELAGDTKPVRLTRQGDHRNWHGPDPEVVLAFLRQYVPDDLVQVTARTGPPQSPDEADRRLADLDRTGCEQQKAGRATCGVLLAAYLVLAVTLLTTRGNPLAWDWLRWAAFGALVLVFALLGIALWMAHAARRRQLRAQRSELIGWIAAGRGQAAQR
jgi:hypothetical protein